MDHCIFLWKLNCGKIGEMKGRTVRNLQQCPRQEMLAWNLRYSGGNEKWSDSCIFYSRVGRIC